MKLTRDGIAYDLRSSPYIVKVHDIYFYFSSRNHLDKFTENLVENRDMLRYSLTNRFKFEVDLNTLYDLALYRKVETRGFLIKYEGEWFRCVKEVRLNGVKKISKKSQTQLGVLTQNSQESLKNIPN